MYGDIKITLVKTETLAEYVVRTFALERVSLPSPGPSGGARGGGAEPTSPPPPAQEQEQGGGHRCPPSKAAARSLLGALGVRKVTGFAGLQREDETLKTMKIVCTGHCADPITHTVSALESSMGLGIYY